MNKKNTIINIICILLFLLMIFLFVIGCKNLKSYLENGVGNSKADMDKKFKWQDVIRIELVDGRIIYCTAYKKSDYWIICYSQGQVKYQIPVARIKLVEYSKNQNVK